VTSFVLPRHGSVDTGPASAAASNTQAGNMCQQGIATRSLEYELGYTRQSPLI
jgi:hypothetical protein